MNDAIKYRIYRAPEQLAELNELKIQRYAQFKNGITDRPGNNSLMHLPHNER